MDFECIKLEYEGKVAVITLNTPKKLNAISIQCVEEISTALTLIKKSEARCLLLTGAGRAFSAGALLGAGGPAGPTVEDTGQILERYYHPLMNKLKVMDIPFVSAVNGGATGVSMSLALAADFVLAAKSAYFFQAFANLGLVPDGGATYLLPRMIGWGRALELSLLGEKLPAEKAYEWGMINRLTSDEDLMGESMAIATRLADGPKSLGMIRKLYWATFDNSYEQQLQMEADYQRIADKTEDFMEGAVAFMQKRKPEFKGK